MFFSGWDSLRFIFSRIRERLWVRPLVLCVLSIGGIFIAMLADDVGLAKVAPKVRLDSVESLLTIMASSMLVIATFAVSSMVAAYASASAGATPRSIPLVIADDVTQNALSAFIGAFKISSSRTFEDDPRFGVLALSEVADKALSPGINDPGTAINVIGTLVRLFTLWQSPLEKAELQKIIHDRVSVPELRTEDLFDDAFTAIARDGAGMVEVAIQLQKALGALAETDDPAMVAAAKKHSRMALARSEHIMSLQDDIDAVGIAAGFSAES